MSSTNLLDLIFQAAQNGCVTQLREFIHRSGRLPITIRILAQCNELGESPLNIAIKSGHHNVVEFLITQLKEHIDVFGSECYFKYLNRKRKVPHQSAEIANILGISNKVPVLYIMEYLIEPAVNDISWLKIVLDCVKVSTITRPEKIIALELLGAAFIFQNSLSLPYELEDSFFYFRNMLQKPLRGGPNDNNGCLAGIKCWKEALALRNGIVDGEPVLPKIPCDLPDICRNLFGDNVEFVTSDQLEQLEQQLLGRKLPENCQILCGIHGPLVVQALLVIQRIFNSETPYVLHLKIWLKYGLYCFASKEYSRSFDVIFFIVNQMKQFNRATPSSRCIPIFLITLHQMSRYFVETQKDQLEYTERETIKSSDLLNVIKFSVNTAKHLPNQLINKDYEMTRVLEYFRLDDEMDVLVEMFPESKEQEKQQLEEYLSEYPRTKLDNKSYFSPIGGVIRRLSSVNRVNEAIIRIIQLLLAVGFNPNATTEGESPLHYLAKCWNKSSSPDSHWTLFLSLLDAGGNLDQTANDGTTVRSVLKGQSNELLYEDPFLDSLINMSVPYSSLCQLCAKVIRQQRIPFEDKLPPNLQSIVLCPRI